MKPRHAALQTASPLRCGSGGTTTREEHETSEKKAVGMRCLAQRREDSDSRAKPTAHLPGFRAARGPQ